MLASLLYDKVDFADFTDSFDHDGQIDFARNVNNIKTRHPYGNVAWASDTIVETAKYPKLREQMGNRNRSYVQRNMSFDDYVTSLIDGLVASMGDASYRVTEMEAYRTLCSRVLAKSDQKKVIFAMPGWGISGVNTLVENLIVELRKNNSDASILFTSRNSGSVKLKCSLFSPFIPVRITCLEKFEQEVTE